MYFDRKCKITFICHGATIYTEEGRLSDIENYPPLSEAGVEEMENMVLYLKARRIKNDVIYSSPALRAVQAASHVAKLYKKDYTIAEGLTSRRCGSFNGETISNIMKKYPKGLSEVLAQDNADEKLYGEALPNYVRRIKSEIDKIIEDNLGGRIIIVTYPEVIKAAICSALDIPAEKFINIIIRTGSATQISYFENWSAVVYTDYVPQN